MKPQSAALTTSTRVLGDQRLRVTTPASATALTMALVT